MNKTTIVAFLLLFCSSIAASPLADSINQLESDWAIAYYRDTPKQQKSSYTQLLQRARQIARQFPDAAEPKIWQAILLSAYAEYESPLKALKALDKAKNLLEEAISSHPEAMEGAALVTLGTLYYKVPGWPVSFGDQEKAELLLLQALEINPDGIDANYFYADFLLEQERFTEAESFLKTASEAPIRQEQKFADLELQKSASTALTNTQQRKLNVKNRFLSWFSSTSDKVNARN